MTLCIAAFDPLKQSVVAVADAMISTSDLTDSTEAPSLKIGVLSRKYNWLLMFAGDPSIWSSVRERAEAALADTDEGADGVVEAFRASFEKELHHKIETEILSPFGLTLDEFMRRGVRTFGEREFSDLVARIEAIDLRTEALICGFGIKGDPHVFSVKERSPVRSHNHLGFHAIGAGAFLALASLYGSQDAVTDFLDVSGTIYRACEAKFLGERALGVGQRTTLLAMRQGEFPMPMFTDHLAPIKESWRARNTQAMTDDVKNVIHEHFSKMGSSATYQQKK